MVAVAGAVLTSGCLQILGESNGNEFGPCTQASDCPNGEQCGAKFVCEPACAQCAATADAADGADANAGPQDDATQEAAVVDGAAPDADASPPLFDANPDDEDGEGGPLGDGAPFPDGADANGGDGDGPDDSDVPDTGPCIVNSLRCDDDGTVVQTCDADGGWSNSIVCDAFCNAGGCVTPPSCGNGEFIESCGPGSNENCCAARTVPGGSFYRSYDGVTYTDKSYPATVGTYLLDVYEVTVSRFRAFVSAYDGGMPAPKSGRNPNNPDDTGWDSTWNQYLAGDSGTLQSNLGCLNGTWTPETGPNESLPIVCLDWYTAFAFCIWDGGRLPTEAEWNYAAAGGNDQRVYPWSVLSMDNDIQPGVNAIYEIGFSPAPAGSLVAGKGKWGHQDLAGNAAEWVLDSYSGSYAIGNCDNCGNPAPGTEHVLRGGDFLSINADSLTASARDSSGEVFISTSGARCARDITPQ